MAAKPTLVLVPGAWHNISTWEKVTSLLEAEHYKCIRVPLPSTFGDATTTFKEDLDAIRNAIIAETTQNHDVVVVVHSYGGAVGQSAIKGLTKQNPDDLVRANGRTGHVIGLAMIASGFGVAGTTFLGGMGGKPPPSWELNPDGFARILAEPRDLFYHDLPEEEGNYWVGKLEKQSVRCMVDPEGAQYAYAGWKDLPVWFLATTDDHALPVAVQKMMVQMAKDAGADVTLREVESSHSPMLSRPKETVEFVVEAVEYFTR